MLALQATVSALALSVGGYLVSSVEWLSPFVPMRLRSFFFLPWRSTVQAVITSFLTAASLGAAAQAPVSVPEPLGTTAAPARPADFLTPAFHKQRRELLRAQLPLRGVAVVFAAPVRNRANDVDYVYHQSPDFHYLTGYEEPDAVLLLFKEPRTVGGQAGQTEALFAQPRNPEREQWTGRRLGAAGAKNQLDLQFTADNKDFAAAGIHWADFDQILFTELPADTRDDPANPADLHKLVRTFREQAGVPADYNPNLTTLNTIIRHNGLRNAKRVAEYLNGQIQENPLLAQAPLIGAYLAATTSAGR